MKSALLHPAQGNLQKKNFLFGTNAGGSMGGLGLSLIPFQLSMLDKVHICNNFLLTRMSTPLFMASRSSNSILMDLQKIWYQAEYTQITVHSANLHADDVGAYQPAYQSLDYSANPSIHLWSITSTATFWRAGTFCHCWALPTPPRRAFGERRFVCFLKTNHAHQDSR